MPPSTTSSQTVSAALRPDCGRASTEFSIFTASAGCGGTVPLSNPVSGHRTGGGGGGGAADDVGGVLTAAGAPSSLLQDTRLVSATPTRRTAPRWRQAVGETTGAAPASMGGADRPEGVRPARRAADGRSEAAAPAAGLSL